jgi:hypothetical protein
MPREDRVNRRASLRDKARSRAEDNKFTGGSAYIRLPEGVTMIKPRAGTVNWNVLPYEVSIPGVVPDGRNKEVVHVKGELEYVRTIFVHKYIGADEKSYLCLKTFKEKCPICEERVRLSKMPAPPTLAETKALEEEISGLTPKCLDLWNIEDDDDRKAGVQLFEFSNANFREPLEEELREGKEEWGGFADLEEGYTTRARFSEETFSGNKFFKVTRVDFEPRGAYPDSILDKVVDLDACLIKTPYDKLKAILWGADNEADKPAEDAGTTDRTVEREERTNLSARQEVAEDRNERADRGTRGSEERRVEPEVKPDPPPPRTERTRAVEQPDASGKCPVGYVYAVDCDNKPECHKCPSDVWEKCRDEADKLTTKK